MLLMLLPIPMLVHVLCMATADAAVDLPASTCPGQFGRGVRGQYVYWVTMVQETCAVIYKGFIRASGFRPIIYTTTTRLEPRSGQPLKVIQKPLGFG